MSARAAAILTTTLCVVTAIIVFVVTDRPFVGGFATDERGERAAIVVRDDVYPFQMWASEAFARGQLDPAYDQLTYLNLKGDAISATRFSYRNRTLRLTDEHEFRAAYYDYLQDTADFAALEAAASQALNEYEQVDLFIFAHTNDYIVWLDGLPEALVERLGLVYNSGCENAVQGNEWLSRGADTYIGHPGISMSPVFAAGFLRRWVRGMPVEAALHSSNIELRQFLELTAPFCTYNADELFAHTAAILGGDTEISLE